MRPRTRCVCHSSFRSSSPTFLNNCIAAPSPAGDSLSASIASSIRNAAIALHAAMAPFDDLVFIASKVTSAVFPVPSSTSRLPPPAPAPAAMVAAEAAAVLAPPFKVDAAAGSAAALAAATFAAADSAAATCCHGRTGATSSSSYIPKPSFPIASPSPSSSYISSRRSALSPLPLLCPPWSAIVSSSDADAARFWPLKCLTSNSPAESGAIISKIRCARTREARGPSLQRVLTSSNSFACSLSRLQAIASSSAIDSPPISPLS